MNVTVEDLGKLKRKLSVEIPLTDVQSTYDEVYNQIRSNVQVKGFRKGKFPRQLAEKRFKTMMEQEATRNLVPKYFDLALKEENLRPATEPSFDNLDVGKNKPLRFDVEFEIVPDFEIPEPSSFKLEEKPVKVTKKELDERIEGLRKSRATPEDLGDAPAEKGHLVTFDYNGTIDGEPFDGGTAQDQQNEIGSGGLLEDFDNNLIGMKAGEEKSFDITFPDDYGAEDLQGKTATFKVTVKKVEAQKLAELNEEFFKQFGEVKDEAEFRKQIEEQVRTQKEREQSRELQEALIEQIKERLDFEVPEELVEANLHEFEHQLSHKDPEALKDEQALAEKKAEEAQRIRANLRLQFLLETIAERDNISAPREEVEQRFMLQAYMMQQNPSELVQSQYGQRMLSQLHREMTFSRVMEHLVNLVLGKVPDAETAPADDTAEAAPAVEAPATEAPAENTET